MEGQEVFGPVGAQCAGQRDRFQALSGLARVLFCANNQNELRCEHFTFSCTWAS